MMYKLSNNVGPNSLTNLFSYGWLILQVRNSLYPDDEWDQWLISTSGFHHDGDKFFRYVWVHFWFY
jgi:hypothetical protein